MKKIFMYNKLGSSNFINKYCYGNIEKGIHLGLDFSGASSFSGNVKNN